MYNSSNFCLVEFGTIYYKTQWRSHSSQTQAVDSALHLGCDRSNVPTYFDKTTF
ncbi:hypothetical protein [Nostoc sp. CALU 546]|uniref:hypothetical protein n=1 Tax=Nostoc sp. CALU 546 TaxID=1867241 RepID=UPI003B676C32